MYTVYLITNTVNQMKYVGVTSTDASVRYRQHLYNSASSNSQAPIHIAIREFGADAFSLSILETDIDEEDARSRELYYIDLYDSKEPHGYNTYRAGMGGHHHSNIAKKHISEGLKGHKFSSERNEKVRQAMIGRDYKQSWSDNLSKVRQGKFTGEDNPFYGKSHSKEVKEMILATKLSHPDHRTQYLVDGKVVKEFSTFAEAGRWVVSEGLSNTSSIRCAERISSLCRANSSKQVYGGTWRFRERSID